MIVSCSFITYTSPPWAQLFKLFKRDIEIKYVDKDLWKNVMVNKKLKKYLSRKRELIIKRYFLSGKNLKE